MKVSRRGVLGLIAGMSGATALLGDRLSQADAKGADRHRTRVRSDERVPTVCQQCPGGCGLLARVVNGEVVGIAGNPAHPVSGGGICPKGFGGLERLYDPARITRPMLRDGTRGRFRPIGWDEALGMVSGKLGELRSQGLPHTVAILGGQFRGSRDTLWRRFAEAYGTPNYVRVRCLAPERPALAHRLMQGVKSPLSYDLAEANLVLSFGAGILEAWLGSVYASRAFARLRRSDGRPRGRFIQVDPRRSPTAVKADRWVPVVPGTDGVLALGLANTLIREGMYDKAFVEEHTFGFDDWVDEAGAHHEGFKTMVLRDYGLLAVSAATGVPEKTILAVARELGSVRPAVVIGERGPAFGPDDLHTRMAIHSLNALVGSLGIRGGVQIQGELPLKAFPPVERDELARNSLALPRLDGAGSGERLVVEDAPQALAARLLAGEPYPINLLFLYGTNPLANHPSKEQLAKGLEKVPLVVSFSPFMDDSTARADLILPDHTPMERWQDDHVTHLAGFTCFSLSRPVVAPRHETRDTADVVLGFAKKLGGPVAGALPWATFEELLRDAAQGLFEVQRGHVAGAPGGEALGKILERHGYWTPEFDSFDAFWRALAERGAWWDPTALPVTPRAMLATPSRKFEFYSTELRALVDAARKAEGEKSAVLQALGGADLGDRLYLPAVQFPARLDPGPFPLRLATYRLATRPVGGSRGQSWLEEQPAVHVRATWETWVEIHPDTAGELGIHDGDRVVVESAKGQLALKAKLYAGTLRDVIHIPMQHEEGRNANDLIANELDTFRGFGLLNTTRVRVRRA